MEVFEATSFRAPHENLSFPGKSEDERILYVTRESPVMLGVRLGLFSVALSIFVLLGAFLSKLAGDFLGFSYEVFVWGLVVLGFLILGAGMWWIYKIYQKSVFIITTRRLTKFIYTTPWTRYQLSLGLDKVVDSGAYSKGYFQALFSLGTFVARSSAGNIKNFKIVNIHFTEDLHNWMNKLMFTFNKEKEKLDEFRAFVARGKGKRY